MHETKIMVMWGVILKLDFETPYDKVCWDLLFESMNLRGFNNKMVHPDWTGSDRRNCEH